MNVIFHSAGNVNFKKSIQDLFDDNVEGTRNVLDFAKQIQKLEAFVHVSTAFSFCPLDIIDEMVHPHAKVKETLLGLQGELQFLNSNNLSLNRIKYNYFDISLLSNMVHPYV